MKLAKGDYIGFLNSDDFYSNNALELLTEYIKNKPKKDFIFGEPDILVKKISSNWVVELNENTLPRILVNTGYWEELAKKRISKEDKKYWYTRWPNLVNNGHWFSKFLFFGCLANYTLWLYNNFRYNSISFYYFG